MEYGPRKKIKGVSHLPLKIKVQEEDQGSVSSATKNKSPGPVFHKPVRELAYNKQID